MTVISPVVSELRALRDDHQRERSELPERPDQRFLRAQYERDARRRHRVRAIFADDPKLDPLALLDAAVVLHHGDRPIDFADAHVLASLAALWGVDDARWWSAAAFDRLLVHLSQPQVAGTQTAFVSTQQWRLPSQLRSSWLGDA